MYLMVSARIAIDNVRFSLQVCYRSTTCNVLIRKSRIRDIQYTMYKYDT
jgi:hypothetical protein